MKSAAGKALKDDHEGEVADVIKSIEIKKLIFQFNYFQLNKIRALSNMEDRTSGRGESIEFVFIPRIDFTISYIEKELR
jgi:hypothetical protein